MSGPLKPFIDNIHAAVSRSRLLNLGGRGYQVDVASLTCVRTSEPRDLLDSVLLRKPHKIEFSLLPDWGSQLSAQASGEADESTEPRPQTKAEIQKRHTRLYGDLDKLQKQSELIEKETGLRALWLGYPVLHIRHLAAEDAEAKSRFAPLFLWPLRIRGDPKKHGGMYVESLQELGPAAYNAPLAQWLLKHFHVEVSWPDAGEMADLGVSHVGATIDGLASALKGFQRSDLAGVIEALPTKERLAGLPSPALLNAAVISMFRFPAESIARDLVTLDRWLEKQSEAPLGQVKTYYPLGGESTSGDAMGKDLFEKLVTGSTIEFPQVTPPTTESDRQLVTDTDHSQQEAVWRSRAWPGCVIQGPPGTGKSQTIVNIIADTLARGQTVLMVCQKSAATDVVYNRLRAVGLGGLCVHVHDPVKERKAVFESIRNQIDSLHETPVPAAWDSLAEQINKDERSLDAFHVAVHARLEDCGVGLREVLAWRAQDREVCPVPPSGKDVLDAVVHWSREELLARRPEIARIAESYQRARVWENPWVRSAHGIIVDDLWSKNALALIHAAEEAVGAVEARTTPGLQRLVPSAESPLQEQVSALKALRDVTARIGTSGDAGMREFGVLCGPGGVPESAQARRETLRGVLALGEAATAQTPDPTWGPIVAPMPPASRATLSLHLSVLERFRPRRLRFLFPTYRASLKQVRAVRPDASGKTLAEVLDSYWAHERWEDAVRSFESAFEEARCGDRSLQRTPAVVETVRSALAGATLAVKAFEIVTSHPWLDGLLRAAAGGPSERSSAVSRADAETQRLDVAGAHLKPRIDALGEEMGPQATRELWSIALMDEPVRSWLRRAREGVATMPHLKAWLADAGDVHSPLHGVLKVLGASGSDEDKAADALGRERSPSELGSLWNARIRLALADHWVKRFYDLHPILHTVTAENLQTIRRNLKERLDRKRALEAGRIQAIWSKPQQLTSGKPWKDIFKLKAGAKGPSHSLQKAVKIGAEQALLTLRPCWITNPEVACQLFPLHPGLFDVVIFDEASQCPPEYALPVIYRGSRVVIAGDEWQMPPTSFFSSGAADGLEDTEEDTKEATDEAVAVEDALKGVVKKNLHAAESLLEGTETRLPSNMLTVHYRSEHPELITFSNHAFYKRRMTAPPARPDRDSAFRPIVFDHADDIYSAQTNEAEAKRVIGHLRRLLLSEGPLPTIGVVTFNRKQRDLVEEMLEREARSDSALAQRLDAARVRKDKSGLDVGLFIKNLENVQGDERDVMVFSTTFGRNAEGKFYKQFGPVGQTKGERRLNVAVTRAKRQVIVVTSMPVEHVATALNAGAGAGIAPAGYLQLYLAYARGVSGGPGGQESVQRVTHTLSNAGGAASKPGGGPESPLEEEVLSHLSDRGYQVTPQIGEGGFRIDIGLRHTDPSRGFALGIECDGATFHSSALARIRDVWRQSILEDRGWKIHRVWSTEWWQQPAACRQKLDQAALNAIKHESRVP